MDPPWGYSPSKSPRYRGVVPYPTMTMSELAELPVEQLAKKNCALLMWCTGPHLPYSFELMRAWGFTYKTVFLTWRKVYASGKPRCGLGWYTRPCYEYMLLAVKGSVLSLRQRRDISQSLQTVIGKHSEKPQESYDKIEAFFGHATEKIECFAREPRPGWDTWGNQLIPPYRRGMVGKLIPPITTS